jgi:sigma-B regulation protein RsbU (phosphoserine phosphatase)
MTKISPLRLLSYLRHTSVLDRAAAAVLVLYLVLKVTVHALFSGAFNSISALLAIVAGVYLAVRLIPLVRTKLLWRLRNRLVVAYVFIAVVPVVLLLTMVGIGMYLFYLQLGAHLLRDDIQSRLNTIDTDASVIMEELNAPPLASAAGASVPASVCSVDNLKSVQAKWPGLQVLFSEGASLLKAGDGRHYSGFVSYRGAIWMGSEQICRGAAGAVPVLIGTPVTAAWLDGLPVELGPISFTLLGNSENPDKPSITISPDRRALLPAQTVSSSQRKLVPPANFLDVSVLGASTFQAFYADPSSSSRSAPVLAAFSLRPSELNRNFLTSVGALGPILVDVLLAAGGIFLLIEIGALITGIVLTRTITGSIGELYSATLSVRRGDFSRRIPVKKKDQLGDLTESFNEMSASVSELIDEQGRRQRLENEISIASDVQQQLFPKSVPALPGLDLAGICRAARSVSGDYYDFISLGFDRVGIALGDISGKGIFAALLMASLQAALRSNAVLEGQQCNTAEIVTRLNRHLFASTSDDRYATFFYAIYDARHRTLTYTNAGHLGPFFVTSDGALKELEEGGTVIGLAEEATFTQQTLDVTAGARLVIFSDGLTEPENAFGEEFGVQRLKDEVLRGRDLRALALAEDLISAAQEWAGSPEQADDMTVVVACMD